MLQSFRDRGTKLQQNYFTSKKNNGSSTNLAGSGAAPPTTATVMTTTATASSSSSSSLASSPITTSAALNSSNNFSINMRSAVTVPVQHTQLHSQLQQSNAPNSQVVADAEQKSHDLVQSYLMNEATAVHEPHPSLIPNMKKHRNKKHKKEKKAKKEKKKKRRDSMRSGTMSSVGSVCSDTSTASDSGEEMERDAGSPVTFLLTALRQVCPAGKSPRTFCSIQMYSDFEEWTPEQKAAYDKDSIAAIRSQDVATLRAWHEQGRILQAANSFGESLLHMACRRGFMDVVRYLVDEAGHNLWIRDDTGRTPLHDACWTATPSPVLVKFILDREPDLLLVADKRGHTPLDYARKDHWQTWIDFFGCMDCSTLLPQRECFYIDILASAATTDATQQQQQQQQQAEGVMLENLDSMISQLRVSDERRAAVNDDADEDDLVHDHSHQRHDAAQSA